jgi:hypothetical protein
MRHQPKQVVFFGDRCVVAGLRVLDAFEQSASPALIPNTVLRGSAGIERTCVKQSYVGACVNAGGVANGG